MLIETPKPVAAFEHANLALLHALTGTRRISPQARLRWAEPQELASAPNAAEAARVPYRRSG